jgi:hypothetical protein
VLDGKDHEMAQLKSIETTGSEDHHRGIGKNPNGPQIGRHFFYSNLCIIYFSKNE